MISTDIDTPGYADVVNLSGYPIHDLQRKKGQALISTLINDCGSGVCAMPMRP